MLKYKTQEELVNALIDGAKKYRQDKLLGSDGMKVLTPRQVTDIIKEYTDIRFYPIKTTSHFKSYLIFNYDTMSYKNDIQYLMILINIIQRTDPKSRESLSNTFTKSVDDTLNADIDLVRFNLGPTELIHFENGIFNLKTKEFITDETHEWFKYDYLKILQYKYIPFNLKSEKMRRDVHQMFSTWGNNKEENILFLKQIVFSVLEGKGRGKTIFLKSDGGDGKSSFQEILRIIATADNTVDLSLENFGNDNHLGQIGPQTKLILGDDALSNYKFGGLAFKNWKVLTGRGNLSVSVKYMSNKVIFTNALVVQNTNTEIILHENSEATSRRLIYYEWPSINFIKNPVKDFNLASLIGKSENSFNINYDFIETIVSYVLDSVEYFNTFVETREMQEKLQEAMNESDQVYAFVEYLEAKGVLDNHVIPMSAMHAAYEDWHVIFGPKSTPINLRTFTSRLKKELIKREFSDKDLNNKDVQNVRIKSISSNDFNPELLFQQNDLNEETLNKFKSKFYHHYLLNKPQRIMINNNNKIYPAIIENIKDNIEKGNFKYDFKDKSYIQHFILACQELLEEKNRLAIGRLIALGFDVSTFKSLTEYQVLDILSKD